MAIKFDTDRLEKYGDLANKIIERSQIEGSHITEKEDSDIYYDLAPEGFPDKKVVKQVNDWNSELLGGYQAAVGSMALDAFKKDKDLQEVTAEYKFGDKSSTVKVSQVRSKTYPNPAGGESVTKANVGKMQVTSRSTRGVGLKALRDDISEASKDLLK